MIRGKQYMVLLNLIIFLNLYYSNMKFALKIKNMIVCKFMKYKNNKDLVKLNNIYCNIFQNKYNN